jgi:hypothetical protein
VSTLTVVLTHLQAEQVDDRMRLLREIAPDARFAVCHGGARGEFDRVEWDQKVFVDDPTLRGPVQHLQSLTQIFETVWREFFSEDPALDSLYLIEYDHLILDGAFERRMRDLALETGADLLGKRCVELTGTNVAHYVRFRRDPRLLRLLERVSVRENRERMFGCLGNGIWLSRAALEGYVNVGEHPPCYCEVYVPTLIHHLGFRVVDVDAHGDLYRHVRWQPELTVDEVIELARAGAAFAHPIKDQQVNDTVRDVILARSGQPGLSSAS